MQMTTDSIEKTKIETVLQDYFNGYLNAEVDLVEKAFHPETRLYAVEDEKLGKTEMAEWAENLRARKIKGDVRFANQKVEFIDIADSTAVAKVVLTFAKYQFTDYLSLLKFEGGWIIVGKIYEMKSLVLD